MKVFSTVFFLVLGLGFLSSCYHKDSANSLFHRERIKLNDDWRFFKYENATKTDGLLYDVRPEVTDNEDGKAADAMPTEAIKVVATQQILKPWILPTANSFIKDPNKKHSRPAGNPGENFPFTQINFDDSAWTEINLPHDWAIAGPFLQGQDAEVGGGMGRLPSNGVAWYRKKIDIPLADKGRSIYLEIDGAMSYAMVWINGHLAGGWPYGYASWRIDLTPYVVLGGENQIAIRLDNPNSSSRWYPGGGLYRNLWLTKTSPIQIAQYGTRITSTNVSTDQATINLDVTIDNKLPKDASISLITSIFYIDNGKAVEIPSAVLKAPAIKIPANDSRQISSSAIISKPKLWGPAPNQTPNRYVAVTKVFNGEQEVDQYETKFGIRDLRFDSENGLFVNGEHIYIQGANQHHDLGALGAAFNVRAAERQLELLREMGTNAIRLAHNPPAPELLELTDKMGFLVIDEIFDVWERKKTPLDFHLIFPEWYEADLRSFIRRDRNSPSVIIWSIGNEVGEQYTDNEGAAVAQKLQTIANEEDPTRPTAAAMNYAKPDMPLPGILDTISLNYQGEGIRNAPAYSHLQGIKTPPLYPAFHQKFPNKLVLSTENAAAVSTRGEYLFPVTPEISAPVSDGAGGDPNTQQVSSYELYTAPFGSSADKVFGSLEQHPFVGGGFVWSGWDYIGEPTPYYSSRSSYFGAIDLAGFKKDRFYLYQSHWRPDYPMAHLLPHWNWPQRLNQITPVHLFTSGDEAELFLNGQSLGRKKKAPFEYRLRWDDVKYQPGTLKAIVYKNGKLWAEDTVETTGPASTIQATADRNQIKADGDDLSFISVSLMDSKGRLVPTAKNLLVFQLEGPGEIVATDNGDPTSMVSFKSTEREAFNGYCLVIVKAKAAGQLKLTASSKGLSATELLINAK